MFAMAMAAVLACMAMLIFHVFRSHRVFDRLLGVNSFGTKTVLLIAVVGFLMGRPAFLDIALVYALINFIGNVAVLKFVKYGDLGALTQEVLRARGGRRGT